MDYNKIDSEFDEKVNELDNYFSKDIIEESPVFEFGYKIREGNYIWTVPDWGNIKKYVHNKLQEAYKEGYKKAVGKIPDNWIMIYQGGMVIPNMYSEEFRKHLLNNIKD